MSQSGETKPMANYAPTELAELVTQAQWTALGIAQDEPLLRSSLHHSPLSLRLLRIR
jgi:hypothetical protein